MINPMRPLADELAADAGVAAIAGTRVRIDEPDRDDATTPFQAFVVLVDYGPIRPEPRVPVQERRVLAKCYGADADEAERLYNAVSLAWHLMGPRVYGSVGIYASLDDTDSGISHDPDTRQPYFEAVFSHIAPTVALA